MLIKYSNISKLGYKPNASGQQIWPLPGTLWHATYAEADKKRNSRKRTIRAWLLIGPYNLNIQQAFLGLFSEQFPYRSYGLVKKQGWEDAAI
jgi:hypothetical protein